EYLSSEDLTERRLATRVPPGPSAVTLVGCGRALPEHEIRIVGEDGLALGDREIGEITLAGPSVMLGYYKNPELTSQTIRDGWLYTGDLGYLSGGELFVCGRAKDIIIVNGRKYHPQDLEWALSDMAGVRRGRLVAFGTVEQGVSDRVVIIVEPSGTIPAEALAETIRVRISEAFGLYVDDIVAVPSGTIGRTTSGKVQRAATRARYERGSLLDEATDEAGLPA
ncbi:MAG: AMP-binding protein, partial [Acidobacteriota bacterium]